MRLTGLTARERSRERTSIDVLATAGTKNLYCPQPRLMGWIDGELVDVASSSAVFRGSEHQPHRKFFLADKAKLTATVNRANYATSAYSLVGVDLPDTVASAGGCTDEAGGSQAGEGQAGSGGDSGEGGGGEGEEGGDDESEPSSSWAASISMCLSLLAALHSPPVFTSWMQAICFAVILSRMDEIGIGTLVYLFGLLVFQYVATAESGTRLRQAAASKLKTWLRL